MTRSALLLALGVFAALPVASAQAQDRKACDVSYDKAQTFRDAKKLTDAREQLRLCARATCPASIVSDCTTWLTEIEPRIPSVVPVAVDATGSVLANVTVSIDGAPARRLDGTSWDLDPGQHTFAFVGADGAKGEKTTLVIQGQKDQLVTATLGGRGSLSAAVPPTPAAVPPPVAVASSAPADSSADTPPPQHGGSLLRPVGFGVGGVGVAGVIVGAIFGGLALSTKGSDCPTETTCTMGGASKANGEATVSTIGFVAGGVLAAGGLTMVLLAPKPGAAQSTAVQVSPLLGSGAGGVAVAGSWL